VHLLQVAKETNRVSAPKMPVRLAPGSLRGDVIASVPEGEAISEGTMKRRLLVRMGWLPPWQRRPKCLGTAGARAVELRVTPEARKHGTGAPKGFGTTDVPNRLAGRYPLARLTDTRVAHNPRTHERHSYQAPRRPNVPALTCGRNAARETTMLSATTNGAGREERRVALVPVRLSGMLVAPHDR
jgi:hypothetical protein